MENRKRKLNTLTIGEKVRLINEVELGAKKKKDIAAEFDIPASTLSTIMKNRQSILNASQVNGSCNARKRLKESAFPCLEKAMLEWFRCARDKNLPISGPIVLQKAEQFAKSLKYEHFKASQGWLENFKKRNAIVQKVMCGESAEVSETDCSVWREEHLKPLLQQYKPQDIFNADETGLFFKCLPDKTLTFSSEKCHGGKRSKDRVTLMVGSNMTGTEKLDLLLIGKSEKPRCFTGIKSLPLTYRFNKKSWMTGSLYEEWLYKLDRKFTVQKRNVLLFVDNCPAHPKTISRQLTSIRVVFFPPNVTSKLQPMDQGIIHNLKQKYRKRIVLRILRAFENNDPPKVTLLDCVHEIKKAWDEVTPTTITNCFKQAGFMISTETTGQSEQEMWDVEDELPISAWITLQRELKLPENLTLEAYVDVDKNLQSTEIPTEDEIVKSILQEKQVHSSDSENGNSDVEEAPAIPTIVSVFNAIDTISTFLSAQDNVPPDMFNKLSALEKYCEKQQFTNKKQTKITDYLRSTDL